MAGTRKGVQTTEAACPWIGMELGTREVFVTVVFGDIRGFAPFCEEHSPEEVESLLRTYSETGDTTARRFGSGLDKFMGDAIMLYFFE